MSININKAAQIIKQGGLVAFPTETVYGLGADASNQQACLNIFHTKGRPSNNPLIVHVDSIEKAKELVEFNDDAIKLVEFWPGPLTMVLPKKAGAGLADCVTAGLPTVAIRIPADKTAMELINSSGCPIAAPSANKSGRLSTTTYQHVKESFGDDIFILQSYNKTSYGLESTIIDLSTSTPTILRYGFITPDAIKNVLKKEIAIASTLSEIKAPGMLHKHYAPRTKLRLDAINLRDGEVGLNFANSELNTNGSMNLSKNGDLIEAAANLFDYLHQLDKFALEHNFTTIAVAKIPDTGVGLAINDRLRRAAE